MGKIKSLLRVIGAAVLLTSLIACGGKDSNKTAGVPGNGLPGGPGIGTCSGCGNWPQAPLFMSSAYGLYTPMAMSIEVMGDQQQISYLSTYSRPVATYQGQMFLRQAAINVTGQINYGNCIIQPGQFTLVNSQVGMYQGGQFSVPMAELVSGNQRILVSFESAAIVDANLDNQPEGFYVRFVIQQGPGYQGPQVPCMDINGISLGPQ